MQLHRGLGQRLRGGGQAGGGAQSCCQAARCSCARNLSACDWLPLSCARALEIRRSQGHGRTWRGALLIGALTGLACRRCSVPGTGTKGAKLLEGGAAESWSCSVLDALGETRGRNGRCGWISDALVLKGARKLRAAGAAVRNTEEGASGSDRADAHVDARWVASHRDRL